MHNFYIAVFAAFTMTMGASCFNTQTTLCEATGLRCRPGQICAIGEAKCIPIGGCGDGVITAGEECDDGNLRNYDGCSKFCTLECGNRIVDPGEDCDKGSEDSPGCDSDCTFVICGDGHQNLAAGEECDNPNLPADQCNSICKIPRCGDLFYDPARGEQCDTGGDTLACDHDCTLALCGDSYINIAAGEQCEEGGLDTARCDSDCTDSFCGDGYVNMKAGEECDDGNDVTTDDCPDGRLSGVCQKARCGDGYIWAGHEQCDSGRVDSINCDIDCTVVECGDGHANMAAGEECDDGNDVTTDACPEGKPGGTCKTATCGDGYIWAGVEICDKGRSGIPATGCDSIYHCNYDCTACLSN